MAPPGNTPKKSGREHELLADEAYRIIRSEMIRRGFDYKRLLTRLESQTPEGQEPTESLQTLINKVNRGRFSFAFALRLCRAMGITQLNLAPLPELAAKDRAQP